MSVIARCFYGMVLPVRTLVRLLERPDELKLAPGMNMFVYELDSMEARRVHSHTREVFLSLGGTMICGELEYSSNETEYGTVSSYTLQQRPHEQYECLVREYQRLTGHAPDADRIGQILWLTNECFHELTQQNMEAYLRDIKRSLLSAGSG